MKRWIAPVAVVAALPLAALTLFSPFYQSNDDVVLRLLAERSIPFLMFINVALGELLALAYRIAPAVPWYDLLMGASLMAAAFALPIVWSGSGKLNEVTWTSLFAAFFLLPAFVSVQYSVVGMCCAAAGIGLLSREETRTVGTLLLVWGSLIRFEGAMLIALEGALLALPFALRGKRLRAPILAALALAGAFFAANRIAYQRAAGWDDFYEYHELRSRLGEHLAPERITPEAMARLGTDVGWSANDLALFRDWFFTDPALYSLANVRKAERIFYEPRARWRLKRGIDIAKSFVVEMRLGFALMLLFVVARGGARLLAYFAFAALTVVVLAGVVGLVFRAPPARIAWPMLILAATMLTIAARSFARPPHPAIAWPAALIAAVVTARALGGLHGASEVHRAAAELVPRDVAALRRTGATFFVIHGSAFPYESTWRPLHAVPPPFDFVPLGFQARTPPVQDVLRRRGMSDLPSSICSDPNVALIAFPHTPPMLVTFLREHRGESVRFELFFRSESFTAWRCSK
jgi:hypothetical protein